MKTHKRILHGVIPARTVPAGSLAGSLRTDPPARATARGILILVLALGGLGAGAAASPGHGSAGHPSSHQRAGTILLAAGTSQARGPWIY